jgi:hypothetical protein|tara:strand:- start:3577 stop:3831 length:255 start_codon:yes stop_codon:yes gene_type:complete
MNEQDIGELATVAESAKEMLHSNVFNMAFESMNQTIIDQILATPTEADAERERLYMMFKAGQTFVQQFAGMINNYELKTQQPVE